jgi:formyltetrahydrofolate deformylase
MGAPRSNPVPKPNCLRKHKSDPAAVPYPEILMEHSAVLLIDCPDRPGLVARVSSLLYERGANILHADQHQDHELGLFFMRVEWGLAADQAARGRVLDLAAFEREFAALAAELEMRWTLTSSARRPRVALFCSQYLHCMADLLHRWHTGELHCEIPLIVSNHCEVEKLAAFYGIHFEHVPVSAATRAEAEARQLELLQRNEIDVVVLARYMQILSPGFVARYPSAIINVHHSFLPAFVGARPYHAAHARGVKLIGATSHYVTEVLDDGPIIEQDVARISHRDQVEDLVARGRDLERIVLSRAVRWHLDRRILCYGNKTVVFD